MYECCKASTTKDRCLAESKAPLGYDLVVCCKEDEWQREDGTRRLHSEHNKRSLPCRDRSSVFSCDCVVVDFRDAGDRERKGGRGAVP